MRRSFYKLKNYTQSEAGHVAVFFALLAVPILVLTGAAIDSMKAISERVRLSAALDNAVLSAVTNQVVTDAQRKDYAAQVFWDNLGDTDLSVDLEVLDSKDTRVALQATAKSYATFGVFNADGILAFKERAAAELTFGEVVCMLALAPDGERRFEVTGGARLRAPKCSVQVNSTNSRAAIIDHGGEALAQKFCVSGGASGSFDPFVNTECRSISDPFAETKYELDEPCVDKDKLKRALSSYQAESTGISLKPGTYCGGLYLYRKNITFEPGTYVMKDGPFILDQGTRIHADGVTFILQGKGAVFRANEGSRAYLKAPASGPFAGFAIFQDVHTRAKNFRSLPTGDSIIKRGSNISVIGIVYLPEQKLAFRGGSLLENQAPATSFIGYEISIGDGSIVEVSVDHAAAGIPPIEPRTDESARLTE